ncbi:MAG TPA: nitroreductase family protein [Ktedonobacterales bacterium]|nr:nitroreductase family protein [Ktedonobacterales bacterium]
MDVLDAIRDFRAVRQFTTQPLPPEAVETILNAGRRAQSSKNTQRWQFVAVEERDTLARLSTTGDFAGHLAGAALGIALVAPRDDESRDWILFDLGHVTAYMQLAAWAQGIGSCIATIYHPERAAAILGIPPEYECPLALSFGFPAPGLRERPPRAGGRRPLSEVVHRERW